MGNSTSHIVGCFVPGAHRKGGVDLDFLEPLDEGLGHSFCYVRPGILDSPAITPSNSERFTLYSSTLDSETFSGSFRREIVEEMSALQRPNKGFPETTFKTISGASVSANVSTARTGNQSAFFASDAQEPAASFESTSSFAAIPLQPLPRGSGPLNSFMSGPLERGFASGPLERGTGFMSGPIEKGGFMSGPLDSVDKSNFSAPLAYTRRRPGLGRLMRSVSGPVKGALTRTFSRQSIGSGWMHRFFIHPVTQFGWRPKEPKFTHDSTQNSLEAASSEGEYKNDCNLQWAHGKAGEDRVHVVLSEEQGWLFVGIYDGFSGPDAPDFLMSHLYRAIDKELEGLLWDYEDKAISNILKSDLDENTNSCLKRQEQDLQDSQLCSKVSSGGLEEPLDMRAEITRESNLEEINDEATRNSKLQEQTTDPTNTGTKAYSAPIANLVGPGKKSKRLYELLEMEHWSIQDTPLLEVANKRMGLCDAQSCSDGFCAREVATETQFISYLESSKAASSSFPVEDATMVRGDGSADGMESKKDTMDSSNGLGHHQITRRFLIGSKIRKMYRKQKSLRKKLFPWNYDWHREATCADEKIMELVGSTRRCKSGAADHDTVLKAMARALKTTEEAYLEMVEKTLDKNPELALMGSCVLVMLMKDQDVYVMNLGDSRVILAQERLNDRHLNPKVLADDSMHQNRSRESLVGMELDRISEESPMHNQMVQANKINKNQEISIWRLKMRAIQLSMDHSTDVEEEVVRIRTEHVDDNQAILNKRVKGQLKVTRAFGAEFLKKPRCNEALLGMFQIDYVGTSAYISDTPFVIHHRLCSTDRFLVLSSDGLYQYFSNEEVVCHVAWFMENVPEGDPAQYLIAELLFRAAKKNGMDFHDLLDIPQGDRRKYHDDVSVMVVSLEGRIWRSSG